MQTIILYGSQYGTTKRYADRLAEQTGLPAVSYESAETFPGTRKLFIWEGCMRAA